jgi:hypothetical protein
LQPLKRLLLEQFGDCIMSVPGGPDVKVQLPQAALLLVREVSFQPPLPAPPRGPTAQQGRATILEDSSFDLVETPSELCAKTHLRVADGDSGHIAQSNCRACHHLALLATSDDELVSQLKNRTPDSASRHALELDAEVRRTFQGPDSLVAFSDSIPETSFHYS